MAEPAFDVEGVFGEDYLYFFAESLDARAAAEWQETSAAALRAARACCDRRPG